MPNEFQAFHPKTTWSRKPSPYGWHLTSNLLFFQQKKQKFHEIWFQENAQKIQNSIFLSQNYYPQGNIRNGHNFVCWVTCWKKWKLNLGLFYKSIRKK